MPDSMPGYKQKGCRWRCVDVRDDIPPHARGFEQLHLTLLPIPAAAALLLHCLNVTDLNDIHNCMHTAAPGQY
jgi:hypothetical protein